LALALSAPLLISTTTPASLNSIDVSVSGLRNAKGNVLVCVTTNAKAFPDCSKDANATRMKITTKQAANMSVMVPAAGTYAVSLIHDENGNGKLDTALGMPREGFGFSRNPAISFGPPKFKSAAFAVKGATSQTVKMKYML
jgi:uncharacterized protein (DUF2141 family)